VKAQQRKGVRASVLPPPSPAMKGSRFAVACVPHAFVSRNQSTRKSARGAPRRLTVTAITQGTDPDTSHVLDAVGRRLVTTADHFQKVGTVSFWTSFALSCISFVIWIFASTFEKNHGGAHSGLLLALIGVGASFLSTFWSLGYTKLAKKLRDSAKDPAGAPKRSRVVRNLTMGVYINLIGMGAAIVSGLTTVGSLVAKSLTSGVGGIPSYSGGYATFNPVVPLDVFLVQATLNTILCHFISIAFSLWLIQSVTTPKEVHDDPVEATA